MLLLTSKFHYLIAVHIEILGNLCIVIVCFTGCDIKNFEVNFFFLVKLLFCMTKHLRQKLKYLEKKKSVLGEIKCIYHHF